MNNEYNNYLFCKDCYNHENCGVVYLDELEEVECKYCGAYLELSKAMRLNTETGEYEYACVNCALKFEKKDEIDKAGILPPEQEFNTPNK